MRISRVLLQTTHNCFSYNLTHLLYRNNRKQIYVLTYLLITPGMSLKAYCFLTHNPFMSKSAGISAVGKYWKSIKFSLNDLNVYIHFVCNPLLQTSQINCFLKCLRNIHIFSFNTWYLHQRNLSSVNSHS